MDLLKIAESLIDVVKRAGEIELSYFKNTSVPILGKSDGSPVTIADREAESHISLELFNKYPEIPFVGEEATEAGNIPDISGGTFWMVDALDGTKDFISGAGDFTVNIALLRDFKPVMGVIYIPTKSKLYFGAEGKAFMQENDNADIRAINVREVPEHGLTLMASKRHKVKDSDRERVKEFLNGQNIHERLPHSSSLKFCSIAEGVADIYPRFGPTSEWDIAAGDAILSAAGGRVLDLEGKPMVYGKKDIKFLNPGFVAYGSL